jgi:hypothetical protein
MQMKNNMRNWIIFDHFAQGFDRFEVSVDTLRTVHTVKGRQNPIIKKFLLRCTPLKSSAIIGGPPLKLCIELPNPPTPPPSVLIIFPALCHHVTRQVDLFVLLKRV